MIAERLNAALNAHDIDAYTKQTYIRSSPVPDHVTVIGPHPIMLIGESALEPHVVLDATAGPVITDFPIWLSESQRIPALALTTFARTDERLAPLLADVHCDLAKPVEPALLTAAIARLTGRERRQALR